MFDLDGYLERIGLSTYTSLAELHRAHATAIPFENLDPHRGVLVSLEVEDLQRKLIHEGRGGYCFEQNLLLKAALEALDMEVEPMLARVRRGAPPGTVRPRTHLVLRVHADGASWLADVGFGGGALLQPVPFAPGEAHEQSGWRFRLIEDGQELVLQTVDGSAWSDLYGFVPQAAPEVDLETSNWFTTSHPRSPFVTGLLISAQDRDGAHTMLSDWGELSLTERTPVSEDTVVPVSREQIPALLEERFGLAGFALNGDGRIMRAD